MNINVFYSDEDDEFIATCDKYEYLSGFGDTKEDAIEDLKIIIDRIETKEYIDKYLNK